MSGLPRRASVMLLLYPTGDDLAFPLIQRATNPHDKHSGQISLPGGAAEPGESTIATALRETYEEVGVRAVDRILGQLDCVYIPPSDFEVRPVVGYINAPPTWNPQADEVVEVIEYQLGWLFEAALKTVEQWDYKGHQMRVPIYKAAGRDVWGATALILSEFEERLKTVLK
jgi:8-oxo-dGTP pyrophosphatase MutT (NUDIX family)